MHSKFFFILFALLCVFVITACVWAPAPGSAPGVSSSGGILTDENTPAPSDPADTGWPLLS